MSNVFGGAPDVGTRSTETSFRFHVPNVSRPSSSSAGELSGSAPGAGRNRTTTTSSTMSGMAGNVALLSGVLQVSVSASQVRLTGVPLMLAVPHVVPSGRPVQSKAPPSPRSQIRHSSAVVVVGGPPAMLRSTSAPISTGTDEDPSKSMRHSAVTSNPPVGASVSEMPVTLRFHAGTGWPSTTASAVAIVSNMTIKALAVRVFGDPERLTKVDSVFIRGSFPIPWAPGLHTAL